MGRTLQHNDGVGTASAQDLPIPSTTECVRPRERASLWLRTVPSSHIFVKHMTNPLPLVKSGTGLRGVVPTAEPAQFFVDLYGIDPLAKGSRSMGYRVFSWDKV